DGVLTLKAEAQAEVEDLQGVHAVRLVLKTRHVPKKALSRRVLVEVTELERLAHPLGAARPGRAEDLLVGEGDDRVAGFVDVLVGNARLPAASRHVFEETGEATLQHVGRRQVARGRELAREAERLGTRPVHAGHERRVHVRFAGSTASSLSSIRGSSGW